MARAASIRFLPYGLRYALLTYGFSAPEADSSGWSRPRPQPVALDIAEMRVVDQKVAAVPIYPIDAARVVLARFGSRKRRAGAGVAGAAGLFQGCVVMPGSASAARFLD